MPASPHEVFLQLVAGVTGKKWSDLADLYAEDAVVTHPMSVPARTPLVGRESLRAHFAGAADRPIEMTAENIVVYPADDPEVITAEFEYHGVVTTTGRRFVVANVFIMRVRDGLIVTSHDYANHSALAAALA